MSALDGKIAIVTGAAGNLGRATAEAMRTAGAGTVLVDASHDHLQSAYPGAAQDSDRLLCGGVDLTDEKSARAVVAAQDPGISAIVPDPPCDQQMDEFLFIKQKK